MSTLSGVGRGPVIVQKCPEMPGNDAPEGNPRSSLHKIHTPQRLTLAPRPASVRTCQSNLSSDHFQHKACA